MTILNCYPNCTYTFYSDAKSIEYFQQKDPRLITYFNKLKPGAYKADLWRLCVLYKEGGIYLDIKFTTSKIFKLDRLLDANYLVRDRESYFISKNGIDNLKSRIS